jgi:hypothetical protein
MAQSAETKLEAARRTPSFVLRVTTTIVQQRVAIVDHMVDGT